LERVLEGNLEWIQSEDSWIDWEVDFQERLRDGFIENSRGDFYGLVYSEHHKMTQNQLTSTSTLLQPILHVCNVLLVS
jgi:hypothetical protein